MALVVPTAQLAQAIAEQMLGTTVSSVRRFPTGLCHWVYEVKLQSGRAVVVRLAQPSNLAELAGGVCWSNLLRPLGVPLPEMLYTDLDSTEFAFPFVILERFPGTDLGLVYPELSVEEKRRLAKQLAEIQRKVANLPPGQGYGYVTSYAGPFPHSTWQAVVLASLERSETRIRQAGVFDPQAVARVRALLPRFQNYFQKIEPKPFLDDTTTKNVIIHQGQLSGIVDVDNLCFGDPLFTVALTRTSLLNLDYSTDYIEFWCNELDLAAAQRGVLDFYTALFCLDFMGEIGQTFNENQSASPDPARISRLNSLFDALLK